MIIERLDLIAFGLFSGTSIDLSAGPRRFHLVFGPNESGKSTSLRAISSWLFGMPHVSEDNYRHPNARLRVGGVLVDPTGKRLECIRRRGRRGTLRDVDDSEPIDEAMLEQMLGGIDRDTFASQYGLSHEELTSGGEAILRGDGDLGEILFSAGAGVSRLHEIHCQLDDASRDLFAPRGSRTLNVALKELEKQRKQLREAQLPPAEFNAIRKRIEEKQRQSRELEQSLQSEAAELSKLKAYKQAASLLPRWRHDTKAFSDLDQTPVLDEGFTEHRRRFESEHQLAMNQLAELKQRVDRWTERLKSLPEDTVVVAHGNEIQDLFQEIAARNKADRDRIELRRVQQRTDRQIKDLLRELSIEMLTDDETEATDLIEDSVQRLRISDSLRSRIHELAAKYERVVQQRDDARDDVTTIHKRLADLDQELQSVGLPADPAALIAVIDGVGAPAAILDAEAEQAENCDHLRRDCESLLTRLIGFEGSFEQAAHLTPPTQSQVDRVAKAVSEAEQRLDAVRVKMTELGEQRERAEREFNRQQQAVPLPSKETLDEARRDRDRLVDEAIECVEAGRSLTVDLGEIRDKIAAADELVDDLRSRQQEIHQRSIEKQRLDAMGREMQELNEQAKRCQDDWESAQQQWQALWQDCEVAAASPERMATWLTHHQQLVQSVQRYEEQHRRWEKLQQRIQRSASRLRSAIRSAAATKVGAGDSGLSVDGRSGPGFEDDVDADGLGTDGNLVSDHHDLVALYDEAVTVRGQLSRNVQQYEAIRRRRDELAEEVPAAETRLASYEQQLNQWQNDWHRVTESFTESDVASPTVVMSMVRRIDELCDKKRERDILATRIRSIGEDEHAFAARVGRIAEAVGLTEVDRSQTSSIVHALYQRLQNERTTTRERQTLVEQLEEATRRRRELEGTRNASEVSLKQLCQEANCRDVSELPEIERRSRLRQQLENSLRDLREQLAMLAGDQAIDVFVDQASQQDPTLLDVQIQRHEGELTQLRETISTTDQELGALRQQLQTMDGGAGASEIAQSMQMTAAAITRDAEQYARLRIASALLRQAIDHYRRENQSPVLSIAEGIFCELTGGEYSSLKVDFDSKGKSILFGVRREPQQDDGLIDVPAPAMSSGTADALYLALRLASIRHQLSHGPVIPLVIDDCLIQLDDTRCVAALKTLSELSEQTQVILFTHHQHLIDLAAKHLATGDYHVHRLNAQAC